MTAKTDTCCSFSRTNSNICISTVRVDITAAALLYVHPSITSTWRPLTNSAVVVNTQPFDGDCAISSSTAVPKMVTIVWYVTSRSLVEIYESFGEACRLQFPPLKFVLQGVASQNNNLHFTSDF